MLATLLSKEDCIDLISQVKFYFKTVVHKNYAFVPNLH